MNDPGLDEPISQDARIAEEKLRDERREEVEERDEFMSPSRWWFASTAFPLIAGTLGPMASAFSICALAIKWRVTIPEGAGEGSGIPIDDPAWLTAINAAQLTIALISNLALLMNMAHRIRFSVAQPVTIVGWYLSSFALTALCSTATGPLRLPPDACWSYSQAFYYGTIAAALYFLIATLMVYTVLGAHLGHYSREFQLTVSQRTLMLQTISFLIYLLLGARIFSTLEDWSFLDALYWADFTLLTVGIGDYAPVTTAGRALLFPYAIGGIIILGLVIGSIRSLVLDRGKVKIGARMLERARERKLDDVEEKESSIMIPRKKNTGRGKVNHTDSWLDVGERERRLKEFEMMREIQKKAESRRRWTSLAISGGTWFVLWFAGAAIFMASEDTQNWTYFESLYFSYTSLLTIGYGDIFPISNASKPFFVLWSLLAVPALTILISNMGDTIVKGIRDLTLWIGTVTVLPGEMGVRDAVRSTAKKNFKRHRSSSSDGSDVEEQAPGFLGETERRASVSSASKSNNIKKWNKNNPESAGQRAAGENAKLRKLDGERRRDEVPRGQRHYHTILIREIGELHGDLRSSPPRKYGYEEWAWYLRLLGRDEADAEGHPKASGRAGGDGNENENGQDDSKNNRGSEIANRRNEEAETREWNWSWMDQRSPLMGEKEEAEWILERLTRKLEEELEELRREEERESERKDEDKWIGQ